MEYVLETNGLSKRYRDFTALNGLNMHIPRKTRSMASSAETRRYIRNSLKPN